MHTNHFEPFVDSDAENVGLADDEAAVAAVPHFYAHAQTRPLTIAVVVPGTGQRRALKLRFPLNFPVMVGSSTNFAAYVDLVKKILELQENMTGIAVASVNYFELVALHLVH
ncbi:hypothetical protein GW17_00004171 [Ensete ventricosum]|nr:hypothetical protein GW17_00004171 [Ensete ventricosum]